MISGLASKTFVPAQSATSLGELALVVHGDDHGDAVRLAHGLVVFAEARSHVNHTPVPSPVSTNAALRTRNESG